MVTYQLSTQTNVFLSVPWLNVGMLVWAQFSELNILMHLTFSYNNYEEKILCLCGQLLNFAVFVFEAHKQSGCRYHISSFDSSMLLFKSQQIVKSHCSTAQNKKNLPQNWWKHNTWSGLVWVVHLGTGLIRFHQSSQVTMIKLLANFFSTLQSHNSFSFNRLSLKK